MDYSTKMELVKALNDKFNEPVGNSGNTRYDANTGTIYSNTGNYTLADIDDVRDKLSGFAKKCTSHNSTLVLEPSYIKYCNLLDAVLVLCKEWMEDAKKGKAKGVNLRLTP